MILGYAIKFMAIIGLMGLSAVCIYEKEKTKDAYYLPMAIFFVLCILAIIL